MLTMKNWHVSVPEWDRVLAFEGDHLTRSVEISTDAPGSFAFVLDMALGADAPRMIRLNREGNRLSAALTAAMLAQPGLYTCQLRGVDGLKVRHSDRFLLEVQHSLNAVEAFPPRDPIDLDALERRLRQVKEEAENVSSHPPYIGENGNWFLWAVDAYEDSGVAASVFPEGKKGQYLGYAQDNSVAALSFPEPEPVFPSGKAGKLLGYVRDDVVAPMDPPVTGYSKQDTLSDETKRRYVWSNKLTPDLLFQTLEDALVAHRIFPPKPVFYLPRLAAISSGGQIFCAVTEEGAIYMGAYGLWLNLPIMTMDAQGAPADIAGSFAPGAQDYAIVFAEDTMIAVASGSAQGVAVDNATMQMMIPSFRLPAARKWSCAAIGPAACIALAGESEAGAYCTGGPTGAWAEMTLPGNGNGWSAAAFGAGKFVAVGDGQAAYSTDGIHWSLGTIPAGIWCAVTFGGGKFAALTSSSGAAVSEDGVTWTAAAGGTGIYGGDISLFYLERTGRFYAKPKSDQYIYSSADGILWNRNYQGNHGDLGPMGATSDGTLLIGFRTEGGSENVLMSPDGTAWGKQAVTFTNIWDRTIYGGGHFLTTCARNSMSTQILHSADGRQWEAAKRGPVGLAIGGAAYGNGKFVVTAMTGKAACSSDGGATWQEAVIREGSAFFALVAFDGEAFLALGMASPSAQEMGLMGRSTDGVTWTSREIAGGAYTRLIHGGGSFLALVRNKNSEYGKGVARSADGITWEEALFPNSQLYRDITYGNGIFLAVGSANGFARSADGVTWTPNPAPAEGSWEDCAFWDGKFVVLEGSRRRIALSEDAENWTIADLKHRGSVPAFGNGVWCSVSRETDTDGIGQVSRDGLTWYDHDVKLAYLYSMEPDGELGRALRSAGRLSASEAARTSILLPGNTSHRVTGTPGALSVSLETPDEGVETEYRLAFTAGAGFTLTVTPPAGYALHWKTEPTWAQGGVYEVSFRAIALAGADGNKILAGAWTAWA